MNKLFKQRFNRISERLLRIGAFRLFTIFCVVVILGHATTLEYSPLPWYDEAIIIEYGRTMLDRASQTGYMSLLAPDTPLKFISYLGAIIQELAYRVAGSMRGPRSMSLLGLLMAALLWARLLKEMRFPPLIAYGVAMLCLFDPVITQSVRGVRVDIWAINLAMLSVLLIVNMQNRDNRHVVFASFVIGFLACLQLFVWPTAILLWPLMLVALLYLFYERQWQSQYIARVLFAGLLGGLSAAGLILLPLYRELPDLIACMLHFSARDLSQDPANNASRLIGCFLKSPLTGTMGLFGLLVFRKFRPYGLAFLSLMLFAIATNFYVHRFVFLMPYLILGCAYFLWSCSQHGVFLKRLSRMALLAALISGFGYSVIARNLAEFMVRDARSHRSLVALLREQIGPAGTRVYVDTFQTYYAGRELGWKQYHMTMFYPPEHRGDLLSSLDWYLSDSLTEEASKILQENGFVFQKIIALPDAIPHNPLVSLMRKQGRAIGYGPYHVFKRCVP